MNQEPSIQEELNAISPTLAGLKRRALYTVPGGYFAELPDLVAHRILAKTELETVAPLLHSLERTHPYTAPPGYFDRPMTGTVQKTGFLTRLRTAGHWKRYAVAAATVAAVVTGFVIYLGKKPVEANAYERYARLDPAKVIDNVSDTELVLYLEKNERLSVSAEQPVVVNQELPDVNKHISLYSDDELKQYLDDTAELEMSKEHTGGE